MSTPKRPTPYGISALLREAGFAAAGRYRNAEGYRATWVDGWTTDSPTSVRVRFHAADDGTSRGLLDRAALVLTACGYTVEADTHMPALIVTAQEGD